MKVKLQEVLEALDGAGKDMHVVLDMCEDAFKRERYQGYWLRKTKRSCY